MKCKFCEKDLMEGAKFCVYCGKPIEVEEPKIVKPEQNVHEQDPNNVINDPFGVLDQKQTKDVEQSVETQIGVQDEPVKIEQVQPEKIQNDVTVADPFDVLSQKSVESTNESISVEQKTQSEENVVQPLEEVKEEIQNNLVNPVDDQKIVEYGSNKDEIIDSTVQNEPTPIELPQEEKVQEPTVETKIVKKNNPILIIIIFILLAVIIGGGVFVYTKYMTTSNNENKTINDVETAEKEKIYDLAEAKELVDKYYYAVATQPDQNLFTTTMTEKEKKNIAIKNLKDEFKKIECSQISGFSVDASGQCSNGSYKFTEGMTIDYDSLNNKYKYLFGKSNEVVKESFDSLTYFVSWEYIKDKNIFLQTIGIGGLEGAAYYTNYFVKDTNINEDTLIINVGYVYMSSNPNDVSDDRVLEAIIAGEKVTYKYSDTEKDTFDKEFKDKYLDKLDTYEISFKYEEDHYVFESIKKV